MGQEVNGEEVRQLKQIAGYLQELASYQRRRPLAEVLDDEERRSAYELSDGERSAAQIKKEGDLTVSPRTIQNWWTDWVEQGFADRTSGGQARARYDTFVIDENVEN